jgi:outer membrane protein TolC
VLIRLFALVTAAGIAAAAQTSPLTLEDCLRLALAAQSTVSIARQQTEIARLGLTQARAGFLPQAHVANGFIYNSPLRSDRSTFSFLPLNGIREYSTLFTGAAEIDTSGRLRAGLQRARADIDIAGANLRLAERDLRRAVSASYFHLLLTRRLVQVTEDALAEARSFEARTKLLFSQGEVAQADVVKAAAQTAFLEQALNAVQLDAELANHDLASFWTSAVSDRLAVQDLLSRAPEPPAAPEAGTPFMRRLEFNVLDAERRGTLAEARRARADLYPQLSFVFQYGVDSSRYSFADRGYATFVNLNVPIFDWFKARSAARQFQIHAQQIDANRQITERTLSKEYQSALARVKMIYLQISLTDAQVKASDDNLKLSRIRYEGGEGSTLDVVAAQNQLAQARTNYYTALAGYLNARADLEVATGR